MEGNTSLGLPFEKIVRIKFSGINFNELESDIIVAWLKMIFTS